MFKMTRTLEYRAETREAMDKLVEGIFVYPGRDLLTTQGTSIHEVRRSAVEDVGTREAVVKLMQEPVDFGPDELDRRIEALKRTS